MVNIQDIMKDVALRTGLKVKDKTVYGLYRGYQVALSAAALGSSFSLQVSFPKQEDTFAVQTALDSKKLLKIVGSMGQVAVRSGVVVMQFTPKWKPPNANQMTNLLSEITSSLSYVTEKHDNNCEECHSPSSEVILVNGSTVQLCNPCVDKLRSQVGSLQERKSAQQPNYSRGIAYALGAAIVSGLVWALIAYFVGYVFFFAGFVIGMFVAYALTQGTEKVTGGVIAIGIILTIFAVIIGEIFFVAFILMGEGISLAYLFDVLGLYIQEAPGDFVMALVTALIGAIYVAYKLYTKGKTQRTPLDIAT
ncbi:MAG: hypothetical protein V3U51_00220 [Thermoplasmata archaeon]